MNVTNSIFSGNSATGSASDSGGIYNNGTLTVTDSTFSGNSATTMAAPSTTRCGTGTVTNSTFSGNSATVAGAIFNSATAR